MRSRGEIGMEDWQRRVHAYYSRMWVDRCTSNRWSEPSPWLEWYELNWRINVEYWSELIAALAPRGRNLLECGAATGRLPAHLAARGWHCTLIDITREGPLLARSRFRTEGVSGMFATADVVRLPFADDTFDVVTSHGLLDLMPDITSPIREMCRVLKPGGLFASSFYPRRLSVQSLADNGLRIARIIGRMLPGRRFGTEGGASGIVRNSFPLREYLRACGEAGLTNLVGKGIWPLPAVVLPEPLMRAYLSLSRKLEPQWVAFNRSRSPWTARWGSMLAVHGIKAT